MSEDWDLALRLIGSTALGVSLIWSSSQLWRSAAGKISLAGILAGLLLLATIEARAKIRDDAQREARESQVRVTRDREVWYCWRQLNLMLWNLKEEIKYWFDNSPTQE
jgi:predicted MFS family arabinose efflux permease